MAEDDLAAAWTEVRRIRTKTAGLERDRDQLVRNTADLEQHVGELEEPDLLEQDYYERLAAIRAADIARWDAALEGARKRGRS